MVLIKFPWDCAQCCGVWRATVLYRRLDRGEKGRKGLSREADFNTPAGAAVKARPLLLARASAAHWCIGTIALDISVTVSLRIIHAHQP
jgi:hypothetical protein